MTGVKSKDYYKKTPRKCLHTIKLLCTERSSIFQVPLRLTGRKVRLLQLAEDRIYALRLLRVIISLRGISIFNVLSYRVTQACIAWRQESNLLCSVCATYVCVCLVCVTPLLHPWFRFYSDPLWYQAFPVHV